MSGATPDNLKRWAAVLGWGCIAATLIGFVVWSFNLSGQVDQRRQQVSTNVRTLIAVQTDSLDAGHRTHLRSLGLDLERQGRPAVERDLRVRNAKLSKDLGDLWAQVNRLLSASQMLAGLTLFLATLVVLQQLRATRRAARLAEETARAEASLELEAVNEELRVARDEAVAAERMKTRLLQLLGHELRTPISTVRGHAEMMEEEGLPTAGLLHAVGQLERRVSQVLDLVEPTPMHAAPQESTSVIEVLGPLCVQFEAVLDCPPGLRVDLHPERLGRIAREVLSNAQRFAHSPTVTCLSQGSHTVIRFEDEGPGMTEAEVARATEPFWQADMRPTRKHRGLGLGLAVARRHATLGGATLHLRSSPGRGQMVELEVETSTTPTT